MSPPPGELPDWLRPLDRALLDHDRRQQAVALRPGVGGRAAAVLVLIGAGDRGPEILFVERASTMRTHAGQIAFPGGANDPGDPDLVATAVREAHEETGVDAAGVEPIGVLPAAHVAVSGFDVTTVVAWWRRRSPVRPVDPREVASVVVVPVADLTDPANRGRVRHPPGRWTVGVQGVQEPFTPLRMPLHRSEGLRCGHPDLVGRVLEELTRTDQLDDLLARRCRESCLGLGCLACSLADRAGGTTVLAVTACAVAAQGAVGGPEPDPPARGLGAMLQQSEITHRPRRRCVQPPLLNPAAHRGGMDTGRRASSTQRPDLLVHSWTVARQARAGRNHPLRDAGSGIILVP